MPSSRIDTTGISGSGTVSSTAHARASAASVACVAVEVVIVGLPGSAGVLACEALHFGQHETHVLRMLAVLAGRNVLDRFGQFQRGFVERGADVLEPRTLEVRSQRPDAGGGDRLFHGVRAEKLARVRQQ